MELVLASNNKGKLKEIRALAGPFGIDVRTAAELGFYEDVEETGDTFEENARLKASVVAKALGRPALADDSGLVVEALGGAPGVYSARYGGGHGDDAANNKRLMAEMENVPPAKRGAAFVCVMVCQKPDGGEIMAEGRLEGVIAREPAGENGFGYDPVFFLPELGLTTAQIPREKKNAISHRGNALRGLMEKLPEFLKADC